MLKNYKIIQKKKLKFFKKIKKYDQKEFCRINYFNNCNQFV